MELVISLWQAVIFDMDGLLVDSEPAWHIVESELVGARGHRLTEEVRARTIGLGFHEFVRLLRDEFDMQDSVEDLATELTERMVALIPREVRAKPGADELLAYVVRHDIPRAVASSSVMPIINAMLHHMGWEDIFTTRCSTQDDARGKPSPDVYLRAARLLGYAPDQCLALEDSPTGARAAVAAGMTCFAVPDLTHTGRDALANITPHVYNSLHDVLTRLNGA